MTNEKTASTIATALAASTWPSLNFAKMYSGAVWVRPERFPDTRIVEPNSPTDRANVKQSPADDGATQAGKRHMPECLPSCRTHGRRRLFERLAHRFKDGHYHAEGKRERNENIRQDNCVRREHYLHIGRQITAEQSIRAPQKQEGKTGHGRRDGGRYRDQNDDRVSAPERITGKYIRRKKPEDHVKGCSPKAGYER